MIKRLLDIGLLQEKLIRFGDHGCTAHVVAAQTVEKFNAKYISLGKLANIVGGIFGFGYAKVMERSPDKIINTSVPLDRYFRPFEDIEGTRYAEVGHWFVRVRNSAQMPALIKWIDEYEKDCRIILGTTGQVDRGNGVYKIYGVPWYRPCVKILMSGKIVAAEIVLLAISLSLFLRRRRIWGI